MKFSSLCEVIAAAHLSRYVPSVFKERGGILLAAPPGQLKTTAVEIVEEFDRVLIISNITGKSLNAMRQDILAGQIATLCFSDLEMVYRRHGSVSAQIEGTLMALAAEGFRNPGFSDQRVQALPARCTIVGCMTNKFFEQKQEEWRDNGFIRRFICCQYQMDDPERLESAILAWKKAEIDGDFVVKVPLGDRTIPYAVTVQEAQHLNHSMRFITYDRKIPLILAQKIYSVMKWKFKDAGKVKAIWDDFAQSLSKNGCTLYTKDLPTRKAHPKKRKKINGKIEPITEIAVSAVAQ